MVGLALALLGHALVRPLTAASDPGSLRRHAAKWLPVVLIVAYEQFIEGDSMGQFGVRWEGTVPFGKRVVVGTALSLQESPTTTQRRRAEIKRRLQGIHHVKTTLAFERFRAICWIYA